MWSNHSQQEKASWEVKDWLLCHNSLTYPSMTSLQLLARIHSSFPPKLRLLYHSRVYEITKNLLSALRLASLSLDFIVPTMVFTYDQMIKWMIGQIAYTKQRRTDGQKDISWTDRPVSVLYCEKAVSLQALEILATATVRQHMRRKTQSVPVSSPMLFESCSSSPSSLLPPFTPPSQAPIPSLLTFVILYWLITS